MSHRSEVSASAISQERPDSEVLAKPERRRFTAEYKLRILQEAEQCANGERGARGLEPRSGRRPPPLSLCSRDLRGRTALDLTDVN